MAWNTNRSPPNGSTAKSVAKTGATGASPPTEIANEVAPGWVRSKPEATVLHERKPFSASHIRGDHFELRSGRIKSGSAINSVGRIDYGSTVPTPMKRSHFLVKQNAENVKAGAKRFWGALRASSKAAIRAARSAALALQAAAGAGGAAVVAIVIILYLGAGILASPFGILAHFETDKGETPLVHGAVPLTTAIEQINKEYTSKNEGRTQGKTDSLYIAVDGNDEGRYEPQNWTDVLAVFAVKVALDPENAMDVIELDKTRVALLRQIFWDMNEIQMRTESEVYTEQITDPNTGQTTTVERTRSVLCIEGHSDAYTDMVEKYHLNKDQQAVLEQLTGNTRQTPYTLFKWAYDTGTL